MLSISVSLFITHHYIRLTKTGNISQKRKTFQIIKKQAGAELGQAQLKLGFNFTLVDLYFIEEQEILLTRLTSNSLYLPLRTSSQNCQQQLTTHPTGQVYLSQFQTTLKAEIQPNQANQLTSQPSGSLPEIQWLAMKFSNLVISQLFQARF